MKMSISSWIDRVESGDCLAGEFWVGFDAMPDRSSVGRRGFQHRLACRQVIKPLGPRIQRLVMPPGASDRADVGRKKKPGSILRRLFWRACVVAMTVAVILFFLTLATWWVMLQMPGESHRGELPPADDKLIELAEELRADVAHLAVEIGERNVSRFPAELARAADWIEAQFVAAGYEARRQEYEAGGQNCCNLEVEITGTAHPEEIVIIGAHYDTVFGTPGANDNTSGVAAMLALARRFADRDLDRTVRFVAFVNEEPPFFQTAKMGSWVYAKRCRARREKVVAMMSLETIGYYDDAPGSQEYPPPLASMFPSEGNFIGFVGNIGSRALVQDVVGSFRRHEPFPSEGGALPASISGVGFSDQWSFWQEGYSALMVTDTAMFRYPHYHDPEDTIDKIDFEKTARVVRGLDKVVGELVGAEAVGQTDAQPSHPMGKG